MNGCNYLTDASFSKYNVDVFPRVPIHLRQNGQLKILNVPDRIAGSFKEQDYTNLPCWKLRHILKDRQIIFRGNRKDDMVFVLTNWDATYLRC